MTRYNKKTIKRIQQAKKFFNISAIIFVLSVFLHVGVFSLVVVLASQLNIAQKKVNNISASVSELEKNYFNLLDSNYSTSYAKNKNFVTIEDVRFIKVSRTLTQLR